MYVCLIILIFFTNFVCKLTVRICFLFANFQFKKIYFQIHQMHLPASVDDPKSIDEIVMYWLMVSMIHKGFKSLLADYLADVSSLLVPMIHNSWFLQDLLILGGLVFLFGNWPFCIYEKTCTFSKLLMGTHLNQI